MSSFGISTDINLAAEVLHNGGIIGLPTETVYGLAADALNEKAVHRIFDTKGRPRHHPLIIHLAPQANFHEWGIFNNDAIALAEAFWPGPLTLLVPRTSRVPDWVTGGRDTVAIRVPSHPMAQALLVRSNTAVVAPSANRFGKVSPTTAQHVMDDLGDDVDLVLDGGVCEVGLESTIVECTDVFQILRPGQITSEDIGMVAAIPLQEGSGASRAPGMLESHYAPTARVILVDSNQEAESVARQRTGEVVHLLHYEDVNVYAERLYNDLRFADSKHCDLVIAVRAIPSGIGIAINDRLTKAAAGR
jgi:L-threonylcarbamoyladenylate synthase